MTIQENFSLKNHNTFGVDVSAKYFAEVTSVEELLDVLKNHQPSTINHQLIVTTRNLDMFFAYIAIRTK